MLSYSIQYHYITLKTYQHHNIIYIYIYNTFGIASCNLFFNKKQTTLQNTLSIPSSLMASMLVFHTGDPGSIPGLGKPLLHIHKKQNNILNARLAHLAERRLSKSKVLSSILKVGTTFQYLCQKQCKQTTNRSVIV